MARLTCWGGGRCLALIAPVLHYMPKKPTAILEHCLADRCLSVLETSIGLWKILPDGARYLFFNLQEIQVSIKSQQSTKKGENSYATSKKKMWPIFFLGRIRLN